MNLVESFGILRYGPGLMAYLELDSEIARYYRSLIPKYVSQDAQKHAAHLTVVRLHKESPDVSRWLWRNGERLSLRYSPEVREDERYFWLDAYSEDVGDVREALGLSRFRDGFDCYHITIANRKNYHNPTVNVNSWFLSQVRFKED